MKGVCSYCKQEVRVYHIRIGDVYDEQGGCIHREILCFEHDFNGVVCDGSESEPDSIVDDEDA